VSDDEAKELLLSKLDADDIRRLAWLLAVVGRIEGWCSVNRWIGKAIIASIITFLIMTSEAWNAIRNLLGWKH
jgi:hypothetical protein